ncbi:MAG TPA: hypothetical protein VI980_11840 [Acidimicrobiia bacterium]|nr:hypothetical protein [Acidimicrobiia bacterium]HLF61857.1 hypothetical protein [Acidimicrobiia bacterium]
MAVNPDPKPGRWILPLVILGMIAFTYFFVSSLPEGSPTTTLNLATTTTVEGAGTTLPDTGTTVPDAAQAYLDELDAINAELQLLVTEMVTVNQGFDADPRTVEIRDAESRFEAVATDTQVLADRVGALTVPVGLETNQQALVSAIDFCAGAAQDALDGIRSTDTGELRNAAVEVYTSSAADFDTEVQNAKNAAGATPGA